MRENRRAVLRTEIGALAVDLCRVVHVPEGVEESLVADLRRVEGDLYDLRVAGLIGAHILVRRVLRVAVAIADCGVNYSGDHAEFHFHAPKATGGKGSKFSHGISFLSNQLHFNSDPGALEMLRTGKGFRAGVAFPV